MASPDTLLVVNPESQNGSLGRQWPGLAQNIRRHLPAFDVEFTSRPQHATEITRAALQRGVSLVTAVGGDGTINEVANGFFEHGSAVAPDAALGVLPFGTGGDFRKSVSIPTDIEAAAQILLRFRTQTIDLGKLQCTSRHGDEKCERYFVNIASLGLSGVVDDAVNRSSKRLGGRITFLLASAREAMRFSGKRVRLVFDDCEDDGIECTINTVAVANGSYFGGGMKIAPHAKIDDGLFDVVAIEDMKFSKSLRITRSLYQGTHTKLDGVSERRAKKVVAESIDGQEVLLDLDGEMPGTLPATFSLVPNALRLVVP